MSNKKSFSVRNVKAESIDRFYEIRDKEDLHSPGETFDYIIEYHKKTPENNSTSNEGVINDLQDSNTGLQDINKKLQLENDGLRVENNDLRKQLENKEVNSEEKTEVPNEELENIQKQANDEIERLQQVIASLQTENATLKGENTRLHSENEHKTTLVGNQFVGQLNDEAFNMVRKCRIWFKKDHNIMHDDEYMKGLLNKAVPYYLERKYSNIVD